MKKTAELSSLSLDELIEKKKKLKGLYTGIAIGMAIICTALIYFAVKGKNYALITVAMGSAITLLPGFTQLSAISNEIEKRSKF